MPVSRNFAAGLSQEVMDNTNSLVYLYRMMSVGFARSYFATFGVALAGFLAGVVGCSNDTSVAGNSAETGSPELASIEGRLYLGEGVASMARVSIVPKDFNVFDDSVGIFGETDERGSYRLTGVAAGTYSLEAVAVSGERLLVQDVVVSDHDSVVIQDDTLKVPGYAMLKSEMADGAEGVITAVGTTIYREVSVSGGMILVDSLPAGELDLRLSLGGNVELYKNLKVTPQDTAKVGFDAEPVATVDTVVMRFVAPLAAPKGSVDSLMGFVSDIPLALRLTPENCNFDTLAGMDGRWEVRRINAGGVASKKLPITSGYFDSLAQEAVFWVNVDSLNLEDSLELVFNNALTSGFALDVFPTNRAYNMVWHFDDGIAPITDWAEKQNFPGTAFKVSLVDGVVGSGVKMSATSALVADHSAEADSSLHGDLVFGTEDVFSFSLWIRLDNLGEEQLIFEKAGEYELRYVPDSGFVVNFYHLASGVVSDDVADTASYKLSWTSGSEGLKAASWVYVAFSKLSMDGLGNGNSCLFVNSSKVEKPVLSDWDGVRGEAADFRIGGFAGAIDEVFVGGSYRENSWTYMTYLNQKPSDYWPVLVAKF